MGHLKRYVFVFLLVGLLPVAVVVSVNANGFLFHRQTPGSDILNRRVQKLQKSPEIELAFFGDSSLNAWIDDKQLSALIGLNAKTLGLTGQWGYGGSLAMLERLLERQEKPPIVMLVHTTDMLGRAIADFGYFLASSRPDWQLLLDPDIRETVRDNLLSTKNFWKWHSRSRRVYDPTYTKRDYIYNLPDIERYIAAKMDVRAINPIKLKYLERFAGVCKAREMRCIYAHGPLARPLHEPVQGFIAEANIVVEQLGFDLLPSTPVLMDYDHIGSAEDHVARGSKPAFTAQFAEMIKPYLEEDAERPSMLLAKGAAASDANPSTPERQGPQPLH